MPMSFKLFNLNYQNWEESQLVYHALAELGENSLVLQQTAQSYICLGMFSPSSELDFEFLEKRDIPVFRRAIGGGTVWLDKHQIFYHVIIHRDSPLCPVKTETFFRRFLEPVIEAYRSFGLEAYYRPASDIAVGGKKVSGNGAGGVGNCKVLSGGVLLEFKPETFVEALKLPNSEFREAALNFMRTRVLSLRHFGISASGDEVRGRLVQNYSKLLGEMQERELSSEVEDEMERLKAEKFGYEWLMYPREEKPWRVLKIDEDCFLFHYSSNEIELSGRRSSRRLERLRVSYSGKRLRGVEEELAGRALGDRKILNIIRNNFPDSREEIMHAIEGG